MTQLPSIPVIAVIGGIGSGKSFLARGLAERHNLPILDGDAAGHAVLEDQSVRDQLRQRFGAAIFRDDGTIDRRRLGRLVFGTEPEARQNRHDLEQLVQPLIKERLRQEIAAHRAAGQVPAIVLDAAVLLEAGWRDLCDVVVFIEVSPAERLRRVTENRNWTAADFHAREASQMPVDWKRERSDYTVDNDGDRQSALIQLEQVYSQIQHDSPRAPAG